MADEKQDRTMNPRRHSLLFAAAAMAALFAGRALSAQAPQHPKYPGLPSETPAVFNPLTDAFDYARRDVMIPMRDGVKLHTVVIVPKGAKDAPMLLTRTPYDATALTSHAQSSHLGPILNGYDNFLPLMALLNPPPALKVSVPMNPMVDGWMGDDWFHNGAFRQQNIPYIYEQVATRGNEAKWWTSHFDDYDMFMQAGSAGELGRRRGLEQIGFWQKALAQ